MERGLNSIGGGTQLQQNGTRQQPNRTAPARHSLPVVAAAGSLALLVDVLGV